MAVYLIHLSPPLCHARHYIEATADDDIGARMMRHRAGSGSRLLRACNKKEIEYKVVRVWTPAGLTGSWDLEGQLKARKNAAKLCPVCRGEISYDDIAEEGNES